MSTLVTLLVILGAIILIITSIYVINSKNLLVATIASSIISLILSVFFFVLQAPDVALTEAAIGVALTTIIFVVTIRNTKEKEE